MGNFFGLESDTIDIFRLTGLGWVAAVFIVGATILAARLLLRWQLRRIERMAGHKLVPDAEGEQSLSDKH
jgi:hypothetical protein